MTFFQEKCVIKSKNAVLFAIDAAKVVRILLTAKNQAFSSIYATFAASFSQLGNFIFPTEKKIFPSWENLEPILGPFTHFSL